MSFHRITLLVVAMALSGLTPPGMAQSRSGPGSTDDPPVGVVVDSLQLAAALREAEPRPAGSRIPSDFSIYFSPVGQVDSIRPVFRQLPAAYAAAMAERLRPHVRPQPPREEEWSYDVRVEGGPRARIAPPVYEERTPKLLNHRKIRTVMQRFVRSVRKADPDYPRGDRLVVVKLVVTEEGIVRDPVVVRSAGDLRIDREAQRLTREMRFQSAALDRIPVAVLVTLPITFEF